MIHRKSKRFFAKDNSERFFTTNQKDFCKRELRTIGKENRRFFGKNIES
jgi:hypothetical protein